jgi:hypothetical protein
MLRAILNIAHSSDPSAICTTEDSSGCFDAVSDDPALAVLALRCKSRYRTFEAVKRVPLTCCNYIKAFVVVVAANFTFRHVRASSIGAIYRSHLETKRCRF